MTALELVAEMQREAIAELLDAKRLNTSKASSGVATMPPNLRKPRKVLPLKRNERTLQTRSLDRALEIYRCSEGVLS